MSWPAPDAGPRAAPEGTPPSGPRTQRSIEFQELVAELRSRPRLMDGSVSAARANYEALARQFHDPPPVTRQAEDADGVPAEWSIPAGGRRTQGAILLIHGGGYTVGSIACYRDLSARLADQTGSAVLTIEYRLAPEHVFPAALDDCVTAYRWLARQLGAADRMVVVGDSVGGGLAVSALVAQRDAGGAPPAGTAVISPRVDLLQKGSSIDVQAAHDPLVSEEHGLLNGRRYVGPDGDLGHPLVSPVYADLHGLPPCYVQVGTAEILLDETLHLARRLRDSGVDVELDVLPEGIHILPFFASRVPEGETALRAVCGFIRRRLHPRSLPPGR